MNKDIIKGKWNQMVGNVKKEWGNLTDDEISKIDGNKDILVGKLQEKYGWTKDEAENKVNDFMRSYSSDNGNGSIIKGKWTQMVGNIKSKWGELTDDEVTKINGDRDVLIGKLQEKYGWTRKEAENELDEFLVKFK